MADSKELTLRELRGLTRRWQRRLELTDWKITTSWKNRGEMTSEDGRYCAGQAVYSPEYGIADIYILAQGDREEDDQEIELDVIHELLHILIEGHRGAAPYDARFERALNILARELFNAAAPVVRKKNRK